MHWLIVLAALAGCDRVFNLEDIGAASKDAAALPVDARAAYADAVLADLPIAYWRLGSVTATASDETGNGNVGTVAGGVAPAAAGALVGDDDGAATFDGVDDTITMGDRMSFEGEASFTVEAWARPTAHQNYSGIVTKTDETNGGSNKAGWLLYDHATYFGFERTNDVTTQSVRTGALALNNWAYAVVTYDGTTLRLYVDAVIQASSTTLVSIPATAKPFAIGARNGGSWLYFTGSLDEVAIYDHALDSAQIDHHRRVALGE